MNPPVDSLASVLTRHQIELPENQIARLEQYCALLWEWNGKMNLTRHTDFEKFVTRDLADSMAFSRFLRQGEKILDVGTGGGVPGILLAILRDDLEVALSETVGKKARAVDDMIQRMGLTVTMHHARAQDVLAEHGFTTLVIRAVARLEKLLQWFQPHWTAFDRMLVLKGPAWVDERAEARHRGLLHELSLRKLASYPLPGTEAESVLLAIFRKDGIESQEAR